MARLTVQALENRELFVPSTIFSNFFQQQMIEDAPSVSKYAISQRKSTEDLKIIPFSFPYQ